jgi:hypothetical protein
MADVTHSGLKNPFRRNQNPGKFTVVIVENPPETFTAADVSTKEITKSTRRNQSGEHHVGGDPAPHARQIAKRCRQRRMPVIALSTARWSCQSLGISGIIGTKAFEIKPALGR